MAKVSLLQPDAARSQTLTFTPSLAGTVQRKCACGRSSIAGSECAECQKKRLQLQRRAVDQTGPATAPPIMHEVLHSPGQPLDPSTRTYMESRFGHDFSQVRVHTDARAVESARTVNALAYTVGQDVVFGTARFAPRTLAGRQLLAHELTHVVQQGATVTAPPAKLTVSSSTDAGEREAQHIANTIGQNVVLGEQQQINQKPTGNELQRRSIFEEIAGLFRGDSFEDEELQQYLAKLDRTRTIEDFTDSDNKARAVVKRWKRGDSRYILPVQRKILLIQEMLSGFTGDDDELAILDLLRGSTDSQLSTILTTVGRQTIESNFHGEERRLLDQLLAARPSTGRGQAAAGTASPEVFSGETVLELQRRFKSNAESTNRLNCILIIRELAPQLFAQDPQLARRVQTELSQLTGRRLKMTEVGRILSNLGLASNHDEIRFNNGNGAREPTAMRRSAWDSIIGMVGNVQGWHIFGMAVFDGYHSVTVFVDNRPDGPRVYWADQWRIDPGEDFNQEPGSVSGFRRYEKAGFDAFVTQKTSEWWNEVLDEKGKRFKASLHIWKFRSRLPASGSP